MNGMKTLSQKEISSRMQELRNLRTLHSAARKRIIHLEMLVKEQANEITILKQQNRLQEQIIETLSVRVEDVERMLFGKRNGDQREHRHRTKTDACYGRDPASYHRSVPSDAAITDTKDHPLASCPDCGGPLEKKRTAIFYVEDIVLPTEDKPMKEVVRHRVEQGYCRQCRRWYSAVPLPTARVILGPKVKVYLVTMAILIRCSFRQIRTLLLITHNLSISDGEIAAILHKEAVRLRPEYEAIADRIRRQNGTHYDETSWPVQNAGEGRYAWVMTGTETAEVVFLLGTSRGKGNALTLQGGSSAVGISDDYGAYRTIFVHHQLCWAHPHRKFRDLAESTVIPENTRRRCKAVAEQFSVLYRRLRTVLDRPDHACRKRAIASFRRKLTELSLPASDDPKKLATLKHTLRKNIDSYLTCLSHPGIPPDNNKAERALRHLVLKRRTSFGSRTERGAETTAILASVLLSLWWTEPGHFFDRYMEVRGV